MPTELKVPSAGESVSTVQIGTWHKREGELVAAGENVVELETDKAAMDLPAPVGGRIARLLAKEGATVKVGEVIALIDETATAPATAKAPRSAAPVARPAGSEASAPPPGKQPVAEAVGAGAGRKAGADAYAMPAARRMASEHDVNLADVSGSGPGGRVLKEDVIRAVASGRPVSATGAQPAEPGAPTPKAGDGDRPEEAVPMTALRRKIAERLVQAKQNAALLTTFNEIDMGAVLEMRKSRGEAFEKKYGVKLGFMSFFVKAAIDALKLIPQVNAEIRGTDVVYRHYHDIGVAVSTERGLVVPVLRNAERLSFAEVEKTIAQLATRARDGKLTLDELQGGTFSISNGGVFGSLMSTPIVNPPQSAILGLHAIQERPVARDGQVVIRPMMYVALTYDHRLIDGRESVTFLKRIKECVEDPARMLIEA